MDWQDMVLGSGFLLGGVLGYFHSSHTTYTNPSGCSVLSTVCLTVIFVTLFALPEFREWFNCLCRSLVVGSVAGYLYADVME